MEHETRAAFLNACHDLRTWTLTVSLDARYGEWECDYPNWSDVYRAWTALLKSSKVRIMDAELAEASLFAVARDNECEALVRDLCGLGPEWFIQLAERSVTSGERDAKWQFAAKLGSGEFESSESLLNQFASDADEYVRRRALDSLARIGSDRTEAFALRAWDEGSDEFPWPRMMALEALRQIGSPALEMLLPLAERSGSQYLRDFAARVRTGEPRP